MDGSAERACFVLGVSLHYPDTFAVLTRSSHTLQCALYKERWCVAFARSILAKSVANQTGFRRSRVLGSEGTLFCAFRPQRAKRRPYLPKEGQASIDNTWRITMNP